MDNFNAIIYNLPQIKTILGQRVVHLKRCLSILLIGIFFTFSPFLWAENKEIISLFPMNNYNQTLNSWIKPSAADDDKSLLTAKSQVKQLDLFYAHYYGKFSPWNANYIKHIIKPHSSINNIKSIEQSLINQYSNRNKSKKLIGYGENFIPHSTAWIDAIQTNINFSQFKHLTYKTKQRAITIDNLYVRALPTDDVHFYHYKYAGQGFPFDNLQMSSIWAGTPVYIVAETRDRAWDLIITPDVIGWVKSKGVARTSHQFIKTWLRASKNKMAAITRTQTMIIDNNNQFLFTAYVGAVFPATKHLTKIRLLVPVANTNQQAVIKHALLKSSQATIMPLTATPRHFAKIMHTLIDRPYGWGGIFFYNDCSSELKSLFTPFGIWLPRNSSEQASVGKVVDLSSVGQTQRINYLIQHGRKFMTLVYIDNHIMLYIGNYPNPHRSHVKMAMTYQNIWGLKPNPATRRAIIGKSVLLPLLSHYPEDRSLASLASRKHFKIVYLTSAS